MKPEKPAAAPVPSLAPALAPALPPALAERLAGRPFVALLDIDGTLAPIAPRYTHASIPESTRRVVAELASLPGTAVVAVSGRAAADAARMLAVPGTWTIGNHGFELAAPNEPPRPRDDAVPFAGAMTSAADRCRDLARGEAGVIVEDKRWTLSVHYRLAEASVAARVATGAREIAKTLGLRATDGRRVVEIRPPIDVDKGTASVELLRRLGALTPAASVFCAGDDRSDEDTFRRVRSANPRAVAVRVLAGHDEANYESAAELSVSDPPALCEMLAAIVELRRT